MTDLISQLADAIVSLNNTSPRLPTKADVEAEIRKMVTPEVCDLFQKLREGIDAGMFSSYPGMGADYWRRHRAAENIMRHGSPGTEGDAEAGGLTSLLKAPAEAERMAKAKALMSMAVGDHLFNQEKVIEYVEKIDYCLASSDGKHAYLYDIINDEHRCPCGARARLP